MPLHHMTQSVAGALPAVHVRDVSDEVLEALRRRAARHERSLQRELRHLLCAIAEEEPSGEPLPHGLYVSRMSLQQERDPIARFSFGYRPLRSVYQALSALRYKLKRMKCRPGA